jgi:hypothetical protein
VLIRRLVILSLAWFGLLAKTRGDDWAPNLTSTLAYHTNASLADRSTDKIDALLINADLVALKRFDWNPTEYAQLTGHAAGDWWPQYRKLTRGIFGGRAEMRHRFGTDPRALEVGVRGALDGVTATEYARNGFGIAVLADARKRLNDFTRATFSYEYRWFDARRGTFDANSNEFAFEIEHDLNPATRVAMTLRYRDGDLVSYASGSRPDLTAIAKSFMDVTTFDRAMTAYRVNAQTWSGRVALIRALDDRSAAIVYYEPYVSDSHSLRFSNHVVALSFVYQF